VERDAEHVASAGRDRNTGRDINVNRASIGLRHAHERPDSDKRSHARRITFSFTDRRGGGKDYVAS
jgi:hypothetical protein